MPTDNTPGATWGDDYDGGAIEVWDDSVFVHLNCHGCGSDLTDRSQIRNLYHALGDWLIAHPVDQETNQ